MDHIDVDDEVLVSAQVCLFDQNIPLSRGAVGHAYLWKFVGGFGEARLLKDIL